MSRGGPVPSTATLYDKTNESRLWRRVLIQAITDAGGIRAERRQEVFDWLDTQDFDDVCFFAGVQADYISQEIFNILASPGVPARMRASMLRTAIRSCDGEVEEFED